MDEMDRDEVVTHLDKVELDNVEDFFTIVAGYGTPENAFWSAFINDAFDQELEITLIDRAENVLEFPYDRVEPSRSYTWDPDNIIPFPT